MKKQSAGERGTKGPEKTRKVTKAPAKTAAGPQAQGKVIKAVYSYSKDIIDSSPEIMIAVDKNRVITMFNPSAEKAFGYQASEALGKSADILYADPSEGERIAEMIRDSGEFIGEITNSRKDGSTFRTFLSASVLYDRKGNAIGVIGVSRDITGRKLAEEELQRSERFLNTIFESINDPFSIIDRDYRIVRVNNAYAEMRHREVSDLIGNVCYEVLQNRASVCSGCVVKKTFDSGDPCAKEKHLTFPDGTEVWVEIYTYPILDEKGVVSHVIEYTRDVTGRKKSDEERRLFIERLEYISSTDELTSLLNRRALLDKLNYEVARSSRYGSPLSLILCDIDSFKAINDTYGHIVGDKALKVIAEILKGALRMTDIVGRYGGDEFMLILPETTLTGAVDFAERIRSFVENTWIKVTAEKSVKMTMSFGVTSSGKHGGDIASEILIKNADSALYTSKRTGRNRVSVIDPSEAY